MSTFKQTLTNVLQLWKKGFQNRYPNRIVKYIGILGIILFLVGVIAFRYFLMKNKVYYNWADSEKSWEYLLLAMNMLPKSAISIGIGFLFGSLSFFPFRKLISAKLTGILFGLMGIYFIIFSRIANFSISGTMFDRRCYLVSIPFWVAIIALVIISSIVSIREQKKGKIKRPRFKRSKKIGNYSFSIICFLIVIIAISGGIALQEKGISLGKIWPYFAFVIIGMILAVISLVLGIMGLYEYESEK